MNLLKTDKPYINIHSHHSQTEDEISILNVSPDIEGVSTNQFISIGIHPWFIKQYGIPGVLDLIKSNASKKNVLAIGECGLDKLIDVPFKIQEEIFIEQIKIAEAFNKPLIIHCVKAFNELIRIKKEHKISVPLIIHGFNNNEQIAKELLLNSCYLSFGKALLIDNSNSQKVFKNTDIKNLFLETDDAKVNIKSIFEKAAELKNISVEELKEKIIINFNNIFDHE